MVSGLQGTTYLEKCNELALKILEERRNGFDMAPVHKFLTEDTGTELFQRTSVPDPDPKDPLHFGHLRSGSGSDVISFGSGSGFGSSSLFSTSIRSIIILHIKLVLLLLLV